MLDGEGRKNRRKKKKSVLDDERITELLNEKLNEGEQVDLGELLSGVKVNLNKLLEKIGKASIKKADDVVAIPLEIFKQKLGAAEVLCKYLRENKGMKFSEIAKTLNRDQRTVALNYNKSLRKKKDKIELKESRFVPSSTFSDRRLSILESLVYYLRNKKISNAEIAKMLDKDPRNVWTLHSRAVKKLKVS